MKPRHCQLGAPERRPPITPEERRFIEALARADCAEDYRRATEREARAMGESGR